MSLSDSDRPLVLAHQRFLADREVLVDLDLAQRFQRIYDTNLWGASASISGLGSEIDATATLRAELPRLFQKLGIASLLDAPCGDAGWINHVDLGVRLVGVDIVPALIERLQARAAAGEIKGEYHLADITADALPGCDAVLCRDCLVHLSFANIERAVANFRVSGATWLIATTFPEWQVNRDCEDGDWRALNLERAPFNFGPPVELINENCTEAGGGWRDKSLGVWRLAEIGQPSLRGAKRRSNPHLLCGFMDCFASLAMTLVGTFRTIVARGYGSLRSQGRRYTGSAIEYFTWLSAKLDSIEAMPSSLVSLFFRNAS